MVHTSRFAKILMVVGCAFGLTLISVVAFGQCNSGMVAQVTTTCECSGQMAMQTVCRGIFPANGCDPFGGPQTKCGGRCELTNASGDFCGGARVLTEETAAEPRFVALHEAGNASDCRERHENLVADGEDHSTAFQAWLTKNLSKSKQHVSTSR